MFPHDPTGISPSVVNDTSRCIASVRLSGEIYLAGTTVRVRLWCSGFVRESRRQAA
jgi:hypothetical protein